MTGAPDKSTAAASFARRYQVSLASQFKVMLFGAQDPRNAGPPLQGRSHTDSQVVISSQVKSGQGFRMVVSWLSQVKASNCIYRLDLTLSLVRNPDLVKAQVRNPDLASVRVKNLAGSLTRTSPKIGT